MQATQVTQEQEHGTPQFPSVAGRCRWPLGSSVGAAAIHRAPPRTAGHLDPLIQLPAQRAMAMMCPKACGLKSSHPPRGAAGKRKAGAPRWGIRKGQGGALLPPPPLPHRPEYQVGSTCGAGHHPSSSSPATSMSTSLVGQCGSFAQTSQASLLYLRNCIRTMYLGAQYTVTTSCSSGREPPASPRR
jgi:hypothetical protein